MNSLLTHLMPAHAALAAELEQAGFKKPSTVPWNYHGHNLLLAEAVLQFCELFGDPHLAHEAVQKIRLSLLPPGEEHPPLPGCQPFHDALLDIEFGLCVINDKIMNQTTEVK